MRGNFGEEPEAFFPHRPTNQVPKVGDSAVGFLDRIGVIGKRKVGGRMV